MTTFVTNQIVVYRARNLVNGKQYIGVTKRGLKPRERHHRTLARAGGGYRFHAALRKYGDEAFVFEQVADFFDDLELALVFEAELIDAEKPEYNMNPGGYNWAGAMDPDTPEKINTGQIHKRVRRKATEEEKARRRELLKKYPHPFKGQKHTAESRAKMSAALKGRVGPWTGQKRPDMRMKTKRSVVCFDDGRVFESISSAEKHYGLGKDYVGMAVRGRIKTTKGLRFKYGDEA